jgi:hypothetical protein
MEEPPNRMASMDRSAMESSMLPDPQSAETWGCSEGCSCGQVLAHEYLEVGHRRAQLKNANPPIWYKASNTGAATTMATLDTEL